VECPLHPASAADRRSGLAPSRPLGSSSYARGQGPAQTLPGPEDVKGPPALSGHCVDALGETRDVDAPLLTGFHLGDEVLQGAPEPVEAPDGEGVVLKKLLQGIDLQVHLLLEVHPLLTGRDGGRANSHRTRLLGLNKTARRTKSEGGKETIGVLPDRRTDCADRSTLIRTLAPRAHRSRSWRDGRGRGLPGKSLPRCH
jgi:hypothetical protein